MEVNSTDMPGVESENTHKRGVFDELSIVVRVGLRQIRLGAGSLREFG
jgi:hypothetical protein